MPAQIPPLPLLVNTESVLSYVRAYQIHLPSPLTSAARPNRRLAPPAWRGGKHKSTLPLLVSTVSVWHRFSQMQIHLTISVYIRAITERVPVAHARREDKPKPPPLFGPHVSVLALTFAANQIHPCHLR